jgi:hypothetical protein
LARQESFTCENCVAHSSYTPSTSRGSNLGLQDGAEVMLSRKASHVVRLLPPSLSGAGAATFPQPARTRARSVVEKDRVMVRLASKSDAA